MGTQGDLCGQSRVFLRWCMRISNLLILLGGIVLLGVGIWTLENKTFTEDLLRNPLYLNTAGLITAVGCITIVTAAFGIYATHKEVKVLHLTYFVFISSLLVILAIGAVLAYVFREQVDLTMKAEMIFDVRNYDPASPNSPVTWAWDATQSQLECCGLMTPQVDQPWEIWRFARPLNPEEEAGKGSWRVPDSCCVPDTPCSTASNNITNIYTKDCYIEVKEFVVQHSAIMGAVAIAIVCVQALGVISSLILFRSIV